MYNNIFKFDNQQKLVFDEKINIVDTDDVAIVSTKQLPGVPED